MTAFSLAVDLQRMLRAGDADRQTQSLRRIADLFLLDCVRLTEAQIDLFDDVIALLTQRVDAGARIELALRFAPMPEAPPRTIRTLAFDDEIAAARPVITQSPRLAEPDLIAIARNKGQAHLLAMSRRPDLSSSVTDAVLRRADDAVARALARNRSAHLSGLGVDSLVRRSRHDHDLRRALSARRDIPGARLRDLLAFARESTRERLGAPQTPDPVLRFRRPREAAAANG